MYVEFSQEVDRKIRRIHKKDQKLSQQIEKQLALFIENPKHPSLRIHKLSGEFKNLWSLSINRSIRMVYILETDSAYFVGLGTHDEVYKK